MKNNYLSVVVVVLLAFGMSACQPDVDVMGGCDKITVNSIVGEHSLSSVADGLLFTVTEYKFAEAGKGVFVERQFGDGVSTSEKIFDFTWTLEQYGEQNVGRFVHLNAGENGTWDFLWQDGFIHDDKGQVYEAAALEENAKKVMSDLPNTNWLFQDKELWIDTTVLDSLKYYEKNVKVVVVDPVTGDTLKNSKGNDSTIIVKKEFVDTVYYNKYDTVGNKMTLKVELALNKKNKANVGSYLYDYKEYNHDLTISKDSVVSYDFHWGLTSVTTAKKFKVAAVNDVKKDTTYFEISKFDKKKKVLTLGDHELKLQ